MVERHSILWRRLDVPGHDACRVALLASGWQLAGTAVFLHNGAPARLSYSLSGDRDWRTRSGRIEGFVGQLVVDLAIERAMNGAWSVNGAVVHGLDHCVHLDFGFTPATNFPQVRQLALRNGDRADLPVAWLDVPPAALRVLDQRYERQGDSTYWYVAPSVDYEALLEVTPAGVIRRYPGLWELESALPEPTTEG